MPLHPHFLLLVLLCVTISCEKTTAPALPHDAGAAPAMDMAAALTTQPPPQSSSIVAHSPTIPISPRRVVSLAPNITEVLFALGEGERVVGVTRFCDYPPEVSTIARIGGFTDPDMEAMLAQTPDLILGMKAGDQALTDKLTKASLPHVFLEMNDMAQTREGILALGKIMGREPRAEELVAAFDSGLEPVVLKDDAERPRTLFIFGHDPMVVAGHGTFAHELIERAGGQNAISAQKGAYVTIDMEFVLKLNPAVIVDTTMVPGGEQDVQTFWAPYAFLKAKKDNKIIHIDDPSFLRPGPRLPDALARMKQIYGYGEPPTNEVP